VNPLPYAGRSDTGRKRSANQDRWGADVDQGLFVVADGVATSSNGEFAAQTVTELLPSYLRRHLSGGGLEDADAADRLSRAVGELSDELHARGSADERLAGANSTVVAAVVTGSRALIAYLGDSRAYLWRAQELRLLTRDHSVIQELVNRGELTAAEGARHLARGVLTRHVGMAPPARPDTVVVHLHPGDRILLCSDGLHGVVGDAVIAEILGAQRDPGGASDALIAAANAAGGPDNITVIVVDIPGAAQAP
jgi:PPM family protein phosphatase